VAAPLITLAGLCASAAASLVLLLAIVALAS
jgi:hypothetical protein